MFKIDQIHLKKGTLTLQADANVGLNQQNVKQLTIDS